MREKIDRLIEDRRAEAVRKGLARKLRSIVRMLGYPVRSQSDGGAFEGGWGYYSSPLEDGWEWELDEDTDDNNIPTTEDGSHVIAYHFDGLSSGMNLQIWYCEDAESLKVTYEGKQVYNEQRSTVTAYIPNDQWEKPLESLFTLAEKRAKLKSADEANNKKEIERSVIKQIVKSLKETWGFS